jgi:DNA-binding CsgD family transcriptional regulator
MNHDRDDAPAAALTPREEEIVRLARLGYTNNEIAERLGITRNAVRFHLKEVHSKLETGGERSVLARGWRRVRGLLAVPAAKLGVPVTVAAFAGGIAVVAIASYQAWPGESEALSPPETFEGTVLVDGRYLNGCPAEFYAGSMTLEDFAHGGTTLDELRELNPDLRPGYLPPDTVVKVPFNPNQECGELVPTPTGAPTQFGTPSASR